MELKPCPICGKTDEVVRVEGFSVLKNKELWCDRCGYTTPPAYTWRGAERAWNRYTAIYANGYNECREMIKRGELDGLDGRERRMT